MLNNRSYRIQCIQRESRWHYVPIANALTTFVLGYDEIHLFKIFSWIFIVQCHCHTRQLFFFFVILFTMKWNSNWLVFVRYNFSSTLFTFISHSHSLWRQLLSLGPGTYFVQVFFLNLSTFDHICEFRYNIIGLVWKIHRNTDIWSKLIRTIELVHVAHRLLRSISVIKLVWSYCGSLDLYWFGGAWLHWYWFVILSLDQFRYLPVLQNIRFSHLVVA